MKTVGMIGIGLMGHGIASNLIRRGYPLSVMEHPGNQPIDDLKQAGARTRKSPVDVAVDSDVVILCVTGSPQVEAVVLGAQGLIPGLRPATTVIDCSTSLPSSTERVAGAIEQAGGRFLDAPMTRTPKEAAEGRLNLLVGGDTALLDEMHALLSCFAENITHVGPVGSGHRMKLLHNYVSLGSVALIAEAAACARHAGIAPEVFLDVLAKGGGAGTALERIRPYLVGADSSALRFTIGNACKDLSYYGRMAEQSGAACRIGQAVLDTLERAAASEAHRFMPELVAVLAKPAS